MNEGTTRSASKLTDEELLSLLFSEQDRLPREVVDEFLARNEKMVKPLWDMVKDEFTLGGDDKHWWAAIHATFILGAIGGRDVVPALITSLRQADTHDCDWVWEALPSIFGTIGIPDVEALFAVAGDTSNSWMVRAIAMDGLAAATIRASHGKRKVFDFIASILKDVEEDHEVRAAAGNILLDFQEKSYLKSLLP